MFIEALFCGIYHWQLNKGKVIFRGKCNKSLCNAFNQEGRLTSFLMREGYCKEKTMAFSSEEPPFPNRLLFITVPGSKLTDLQQQEQNQHLLYMMRECIKIIKSTYQILSEPSTS